MIVFEEICIGFHSILYIVWVDEMRIKTEKRKQNTILNAGDIVVSVSGERK